MSELYSEVAGLVRQVIGDAEFGPHTRLDGDLLMDSLEFTALAALVAGRYGEHVDLHRFLAGMEIDDIIGFTVADVAGYISKVEHE